MKQTKTVEYQSCDFCNNPEETIFQCDICLKYLCSDHRTEYPHGDQIYYFCPKHFNLVRSIINESLIPIGFVVAKLKGEPLNDYLEDRFNDRGYADLWKEEWQKWV